MVIAAGEPTAEGWRIEPLRVLVTQLVAGDRQHTRVIAIDGRGGAGKTTLASPIASAVPGSVIVHTDDLAWNEPLFKWGHLLHRLLAELGAGLDIDLVPPAWTAHGRAGSITVPASVPLLIVEGSGAAQRDVAELLDVVVWVQSDDAEAQRLGLARDSAAGVNGDEEAFWQAWQAAERPFFRTERPWERADFILAGNGVGPLPPAGSVAVADRPRFR